MATKTTDTTNSAGSSPCTPEASKEQMMKITSEEWKRKHRDFKTTIDGQRFILAMTGHGTSLVPVQVVKAL